MQEVIKYYKDAGTDIYAMFLNVSKAFDMVNRCQSYLHLLLHVLRKGICPLECRLLVLMYCNQQWLVRLGNCTSNTSGLSNGVKQGYLISPFLFRM